MSRLPPGFAALALAAAAAGCGAFDEDADARSAFVPAVRTELRIDVLARGELESTNASPIAVPRVPTGALKVKQIVEQGSIVEPGDVVVVFDDTELNIELDGHRASFRSTGRQIDGTQLGAEIETGSIEVMKQVAELERDNLEAFEIVDRSIYSRQEILEDEVRLDTANETILFADASLLLRGEYYDIEERILGVERDQVRDKIDRAQVSLGNLVLTAPIGGLIVYRKNWRGASVNVGDTLWPGNVIVSIVDPASTALKAYVLERDAAGVSVGAEATVTIDAWPERGFAGRVGSVAELSRPIDRDSPVKYFEVQVDLLEDADSLRPGMKGEARIFTSTLADAVVVPRSAVRGEADAPFVIVRSSDATTERRPVRLGAGDLVRVSIEEGLRAGENVLLGDAEALADAGAAETPAAPAG